MNTELSEKLCYLFWDIFNIPELGALSHSATNPTAVQYSSFVLSILTSVIGLVGNTIVIIVSGFIMENTRSKIWFLNLAVADFVFLLFLPVNAVSIMRASWPFGSHVCKVYNFLFLANMYASIYIITALNIDRALSVAKPIWHLKFRSRKICYSICALIWVLAVLCSVPAIIYSDEFELGEETHCTLFPEDLTSIAYIHEITNTSAYFQSIEREFCSEPFENPDKFILWNEVVSSTMNLVVPLVMIGYLIPLSIILLSNVIIGFTVKDSQTVASSRLYRLIVSAVMVFFCTRTPIVLAQIIFLVAAYTMNFTLMYKVIVSLPLLFSISAINSCLNPVVYVLVGKQVYNSIISLIKRFNPFT
ncbi:chemerin-like receptor 1 [Mixophyes fleayi]|uniref:chemerin-like receptor 1 n=1 Tax=Mixophyes fleayi TaxID=3061075 RepID=UPI003F4D7A5A